MTALGALMSRDIRIALRVGGGALIGVLFFLTVVVLMPFAVGPDLALLTRLGRRSSGSAPCWRACSPSTGCSWPTMTTVRST